MKYVFSLVSVIIVSVGFLFFLFNNPYFVPTNGVGEIEWLNIFVLLFLLVIFGSFRHNDITKEGFKKKEENIYSFKSSSVFQSRATSCFSFEFLSCTRLDLGGIYTSSCVSSLLCYMISVW